MIGVVGSDLDAVTRVADALDAVGAETRTGDARAVAAADPAVIATVGDAALTSLARAGGSASVIAIDAGPGVDTVAMDDIATVAERAVVGEAETMRHPVLDVTVQDGPSARAAFEVMLVSARPGRISEYTVAAREPFDHFRADGVIVATPAGSHRYARDAGGPLVSRADAAAVVPVSAFAVRSDTHVIGLDSAITLAVERDETPVTLLADGDEVATVTSGHPVRIDAAGALELVVPPR